MYLVVSYWQALPGKEEEFVARSKAVAEALRNELGVEILNGFASKDKFVAVHGYSDEATYRKLVQDASGPFAQAMAAQKIEEVGKWLRSEAGEAVL